MQPEIKLNLTITLSTDQIESALLNDDVIERVIERILAVAGERFTIAEASAEIANRTYHMGAKPTPGLNYDDRLTARLGCGSTTAYLYLAQPEHRGGIRHQRLGKKYHITERAVRDWEGDNKS
jgi:hypothetical protein